MTTTILVYCSSLFKRMFLQYVDNGVIHLRKGFISRLVDGKIDYFPRSSVSLLCGAVDNEDSFGSDFLRHLSFSYLIFFFNAEFDGEREEQDFVFQIICRLKHVGFYHICYCYVVIYVFTHTERSQCLNETGRKSSFYG